MWGAAAAWPGIVPYGQPTQQRLIVSHPSSMISSSLHVLFDSYLSRTFAGNEVLFLPESCGSDPSVFSVALFRTLVSPMGRLAIHRIM